MQSLINSLFVNMDQEGSSHSFIIEGRPGPKRDEFLLDFVRGLNCLEEDPAKRPCCECASCRQIAGGSSMDVFRMPVSGKTGYKVEDAVAFIGKMQMGSYGRHNIGVIEDADSLSETIQNKLLKTLEEPEEGTIILLVAANRDNLLSTVRSRCTVIRASEYVGDDEIELDNKCVLEIAELLKSLCGWGSSKCNYYEFRNAVDKGIKSKEDAVYLIGIMEDSLRDSMVGGHNPGAMARAIDVLELARMDIYKGMAHGKALRRVFLELQ